MVALQLPLQDTGKVGIAGVAEPNTTTQATASTASFVCMVNDECSEHAGGWFKQIKDSGCGVTGLPDWQELGSDVP